MIKWLLRDNPALLGDILEERVSGRSATWVWWQIFVALTRSIFSSVRQHPVLTVRGMATGIVVYLLGVRSSCSCTARCGPAYCGRFTYNSSRPQARYTALSLFSCFLGSPPVGLSSEPIESVLGPHCWGSSS